MAEKAATPQQPVISIRISEALRSRLETLRKIMFLKSGQTVSTSEAAKQLLESARDDRLELVDLLKEPTDSLLRIRGKADSGLSLSQAEWTMVAHYCARGSRVVCEYRTRPDFLRVPGRNPGGIPCGLRHRTQTEEVPSWTLYT